MKIEIKEPKKEILTFNEVSTLTMTKDKIEIFYHDIGVETINIYSSNEIDIKIIKEKIVFGNELEFKQ